VPVGDVFVWQVRSFTVRLSLAVVDRLRAALGRLPSTEEHGGILLGHLVGPNLVEVTGCEFFPSAHRKGTLYDLGARERERVAMRARELARVKAERPVGYFRTHQRPGLFLDQDDFALMEEAFREPGSVALLMRPRGDGPPDAGFFFRENGQLDRKQTHLVFPFDSEALRVHGPIESPAPAPANGKLLSPGILPAAVKSALAKRWQPALVWMGAAIFSFAVVAALLRTTTPHPAPTNPFDLRIVRNGPSLMVDWNRNAPVLRNAAAATLTIDDGGAKQHLTLGSAELAHGSVQFWPQSRRVVVRMDVTNSREISESVTAMVEGGRVQSTETAIQPSTMSPNTPPPQESGPALASSGAKRESAEVSRETQLAAEASEKPRPFRGLGRPVRPQERTMAMEPTSSSANSRPEAGRGEATKALNRPPVASTPPAGAEPQPTTASPPPSAPPVAAKTTERTVSITVRLESKPPSEMHKVIGHIPLLGHMGSLRYRGGEDDFTGPRPSHTLEPKVPGYMVDNLKRPIDIDVLVSIDKSGHVKNTEVLEGAGSGFGSLAADRAAAVQWEPAKVGDKAVASQVVAHYHFRRVEKEVAEDYQK
jgi:hypothetical protein